MVVRRMLSLRYQSTTFHKGVINLQPRLHLFPNGALHPPLASSDDQIIIIIVIIITTHRCAVPCLLASGS